MNSTGGRAIWTGAVIGLVLVIGVCAFVLSRDGRISSRRAGQKAPANAPETSQRSRAKADAPETSAAAAAASRLASANDKNDPGAASSSAASESGDSLEPANALAAADTPATGSILIVSGRITLKSSGRPAAGARIQIQNLSKFDSINAFPQLELLGETTANSDGRYRIAVSDQVVVFVKASHPGSASMCKSLFNQDFARQGTPAQGKRKLTVDLALDPAAALSGQVLDDENHPIEGVKIAAAGESVPGSETFGLSEAKTDHEGRFAFKDVSAGEWTLEATHPDYVPATGKFSAPDEKVIMRLSKTGASISGLVLLKSTGQGVEGATIYILPGLSKGIMNPLSQMRWTAKSDANGAWKIERLPAGELRVTAEKDKMILLNPERSPYIKVSLKEREERQGVELVLYPGHTVRGKVTLQGTGEPIEGVKIRFTGFATRADDSIVTGPNGEYVATGLGPGRTNILAEKEGYRLVAAYNRSPIMQLNLEPDIVEAVQDMQMQKTLTISGRVIDEQGQPVAAAKVNMIEPGPQMFRSDDKAKAVNALGEFTLEAPPFQTVRVEAKAEGYPSAVTDLIRVFDQSIQGIEIKLRLGASLMGRVVDPEGRPAEGASVSANEMVMLEGTGFGKDRGQATSAADGSFRIDNLPASTEIRFQAKKKGYAGSKTESIMLEPGAVKTGVTLSLRTAHFIGGRITDAEGNPLPGTFVNVYAPRGDSNGYAPTDEDGRYKVEGLSEDTHMVFASHSEKGSENKSGVSVDRDDVDFVLGKEDDPNRVNFVGRVVDAKTKEPVGNFTVQSQGDVSFVRDPAAPGVFRAQGLRRGYGYSLHLEAEGYVARDEMLSIPNQGTETEIARVFEMGEGGGITGRAVSKSAKEPLAGVHVFLRGSGSEWEVARRAPLQTAVTGEDGRFSFAKVGQGSNRVDLIPAEPLAMATAQANVRNGETADLGDVEIGSGAVLRVHVFKGTGETPAAGVRVSLFNARGSSNTSAQTDANGWAEFRNLVAGNYGVSLPDYDVTQFKDIVADETAEITLRIGSVTLAGRVLRAGQPVAAYINLSFGATMKNTVANDKGEFRLENLTPGRWTANLSDPAVQSFMKATVDLGPEGDLNHVFTFPSARLTGRVVNQDNEPVEGARVSTNLARPATADETYQLRTWSARSGANGEFTIDSLEAGSYSIYAEKGDEGRCAPQDVEVPAQGDAPAVTLKLERAGGTLVSIVHDIDAAPIPEAWCYLTTSAGQRFDHGRGRDADGVMRIENIPPGIYQMQVSSFGFSISEREVEITAGETKEVVDVLYPAGALRWTLTTDQGAPMANVPCRIVPNAADSVEQPREGATDTNGLWIVRGLYAGDYTISAKATDGRQATRVISITAHQVTQFTDVMK